MYTRTLLLRCTRADVGSGHDLWYGRANKGRKLHDAGVALAAEINSEQSSTLHAGRCRRAVQDWHAVLLCDVLYPHKSILGDGSKKGIRRSSNKDNQCCHHDWRPALITTGTKISKMPWPSQELVQCSSRASTRRYGCKGCDATRLRGMRASTEKAMART